MGAVVAAMGLLSACLQTSPVVVTPQDQASRRFYTCPNNNTLDVTRVQANASVLVTVDGRTIQLPRETASTSAERYTNRLQTLTLFCNGATFESLGRPAYGPCTLGAGQAGVGEETTARGHRQAAVARLNCALIDGAEGDADPPEVENTRSGHQARRVRATVVSQKSGML